MKYEYYNSNTLPSLTLNDKKLSEPKFLDPDDHVEYLVEVEDKRKKLWENKEAEEDQRPSKRRRTDKVQRTRRIPVEDTRTKNIKRKLENDDNQEDQNKLEDHKSTPKRQARFRSNLAFFKDSESNCNPTPKPPISVSPEKTNQEGPDHLDTSRTNVTPLRQFLSWNSRSGDKKLKLKPVPIHPKKSAPVWCIEGFKNFKPPYTPNGGSHKKK